MALHLKQRGWVVLPILPALLLGCSGPAAVPDEAKESRFGGAYATPAELEEAARKYYPPAETDYFEDMDCVRGPQAGKPAEKLKLAPEEVKGRNVWVLWAGGNQAFWDWLARHGYATNDMLKIIDSHERGKRFANAGIITEPDTRPPTPKETEEAFGIRYDRPTKDHVEHKDNRQPPREEIYGWPSGVVGLRLFKNPEFFNSPAAQARWDANRYYNDLDYASRPDTIRPFRVGMSCGFCHIGPHPLHPPADPEAPRWENLSNNIGNQFMRFRFAFGNTLKPTNFLYHVLDSQMPGTIDTSLVASDNINNANTINSFYGLNPRLERALHNPKETVGPDTLAYLRSLDPKAPKADYVPRVLLDGADSVGIQLALSRVYLNIGTYHQQWVRLHNPLLGFRKQAPFKVKDCEENSLYWHATKIRVLPLTLFFRKATNPMHLKDAPDGLALGKLDGQGQPWDEAYHEGRKAFVKGCVACHSSIQPGDAPDLEIALDFAGEKDKKSLVPPLPKPPADWDSLPQEKKSRFVEARQSLRLRLEDLARLTRGDGALPAAYVEWATAAVKRPEFWQKNYLSTDARIPVTLTHTNSARAMATNGLHGHMWEDFTSQTYKDLDRVGRITYHDPFSGAEKSYDAPGGGRGYYRVPTLISIWATAPFLHNNALGKFNNNPSVKGRLEAFDDAAAKLLWPEKRLRVTAQDLSDQYALHQHLWPRQSRQSGPKPYGQLSDQEKADLVKAVNDQLEADGGLVWRTTEESWLTIPGPQIPSLIAGVTGWTPFWVGLVPWLPSILFVALGGALLLRAPPVAGRNAPAQSASLFGRILGPVPGLLALALLVLAVVWVVLVLRHWTAVQVLELATQGSIYLLRLQVLLVPALFLLSLGVLLVLRRLPSAFGRRLAYALGAAWLLLAALAGFTLGQFLLGRGTDVKFGPIPQGVPVNVLANMDPNAPAEQRSAALGALAEFILEYHRAEEGKKPGREEFEARVAPALMAVSQCPDFVMDRGHDYEFLRRLGDEEKAALIKLLKTF
jgi:hypothetical protein